MSGRIVDQQAGASRSSLIVCWGSACVCLPWTRFGGAGLGDAWAGGEDGEAGPFRLPCAGAAALVLAAAACFGFGAGFGAAFVAARGRVLPLAILFSSSSVALSQPYVLNSKAVFCDQLLIANTSMACCKGCNPKLLVESHHHVESYHRQQHHLAYSQKLPQIASTLDG